MVTTQTISLEDVKAREDVRAYLTTADRNMALIGYTEHGFRHADIVATRARQLILDLGLGDHAAELAAIAGYLHDIGNVVTRLDHGIASALIAREILEQLGMPVDEYTEVMAAVGNHEEEYGEPVSSIAAALILGDKSDVHKSRVRNLDPQTFDIHDRVNFASQKSFVAVNAGSRTITLLLEIDTSVSQVMEYFEIFLSRMVMCRRAASFLGCDFNLVINGTRLL